jgi:6-phosphofructokinase 2
MVEILTLTMNPAVDKSAVIERVVPGKKLRCRQPRFDPGGGGINVARAVHKLGGSATACYTSGRSSGRLLESLLDEEGLDQVPLRIRGWTRESFSVTESATGQQYRFSTPGPELGEEEVEQCLQQVKDRPHGSDYLVVSGSLPPGAPVDVFARLARFCRESGAKMLLDATGEPFSMAVAEGVYLIKPNLREFRALTGEKLEDESRQTAAAEELVAEGRSEIVVVSLGAAGALMAWKGGCERLRAPTVTIESKVGAGDSMMGGMVKALAEGSAPVEAVQYGVAAGAAAVMTPGTALCRAEDTEKLFNRIAGERSA